VINYIRQVMNPVWYHGHGKKAPFFEGWYFKLVNADETQKWAFIPGIFINEDSHAFIQVLDGNNGKARYHRFEAKQFVAQENAFDVQLAQSHFQLDCIRLDIEDDLGRIEGELHFYEQHPWPVSISSPGVMGWFGWLPFLECYHGISSLDHRIKGRMSIYGIEIDFSGGRGYIEKDWGQSFPTGYVWQQSNHFETVGTSLTASFATVPNIGRTFAGFIVGLWHEDKLYSFTTYNGTRVQYMRVDDKTVEWSLKNSRHELRLRAIRAEGGLLLGPEREAMHKRVDETLKSVIELELYEGKCLIYHGTGRNAALEVVGDLSMIIKP
jgi:tocopherol cyclase